MKNIFIFALAITLLSIIGIIWISYSPNPRPVTISQSSFEDMLKRNDVKLTNVFANKKVVEVTLRDEVFENDMYKKILLEKNNTGPHFLFNIISVEDFESDYEKIEKDIPSEYRPDMKIDYDDEPNNLLLNLSVILVTLMGIFLYFIPSFVAWYRNHRQFNAIFILNFLLAWTIIGWVIALIWSVIKEK
jgi:hypothetical protein